jgi:hypothetical protein
MVIYTEKIVFIPKFGGRETTVRTEPQVKGCMDKKICCLKLLQNK